MASLHRKLLPNYTTTTPTTVQTCLYFCDPNSNNTTSQFCPSPCLALCPSTCKHSLESLISPPISSPQPNNPHNLSPLLISMLILLAVTFLLITFYALYTKLYYHQTRNIIRSSTDSVGEEHGGRTVVFHPIWYIPTVGLNPTVINAITVKKYAVNGGERVDDQSDNNHDCAVCLAEFEEGEEVRVLPKCNHAFHIPCIDTWLSSHTTCPLCRAPLDHHHRDRDRTDDNSSSSSASSSSETGDYSPDNDDDDHIKEELREGSYSERWRLERERGADDLVSRSLSCSGKIFSRPSPNS